MAQSLVVHEDVFTPEKIALIKATILPKPTNDELELFLHQCRRTGLDPLTRQIYGMKREQWDADKRQMVERLTIQVSIDGFRLVAERTGHYAGQIGPHWCGPDGNWLDVWLDNTTAPMAARVGVLRDDFKEPLFAVARFAAYAGTKKGGGLNSMWSKMGDLMIAKCAEALALRRAFPQELSGLYTSDEMQQAGGEVEIDASAPAEAVHEQKAPPATRVAPPPKLPPPPPPRAAAEASTNGANGSGVREQESRTLDQLKADARTGLNEMEGLIEATENEGELAELLESDKWKELHLLVERASSVDRALNIMGKLHDMANRRTGMFQMEGIASHG